MTDMHWLNPPSSDEIFLLTDNYSFNKIKVITTISSESGNSMLVEFKVWYDLLDDEDYYYDRVSLHHWNCWLKDGKMAKITSPQEELAFIMKHS
jgi:hypothetical protein